VSPEGLSYASHVNHCNTSFPQAAEEAAAAEAAAAAAAALAEEEKKSSTAFVSNVAELTKNKVASVIGKAKDITPETMKKVAAGALGVWGVAAGAGWVMNNLGGDDK
jgi:hypothetical protein